MIRSSLVRDSNTEQFLLRNKDETEKIDKKEIKETKKIINKITHSSVINYQAFLDVLKYVTIMNRKTT